MVFLLTHFPQHCHLEALCFRRTCISGLVVGIDAVIGLSEQLLTTGQMQFLLMHKFSQDHLELFFNAVRRFGESLLFPK
jgi:hypothetical protein